MYFYKKCLTEASVIKSHKIQFMQKGAQMLRVIFESSVHMYL